MKSWKTTVWHIKGTGDLCLLRSKGDLFHFTKNSTMSVLEREFLLKKRIKLAHNHRCSQVHSKTYKHIVVWKFTLEHVMDYGPNIVAHFGSHSREELDRIRDLINDCIRDKRANEANARALPIGRNPDALAGWSGTSQGGNWSSLLEEDDPDECSAIIGHDSHSAVLGGVNNGNEKRDNSAAQWESFP
jgi:hypothetical protein